MDATEDLKRERDRAVVALEATGVGEFEWDLDADLLTVSPRMAAITGIEAAILDGEDALERYVHGEDVPAVRQALAYVGEHGGRREFRFRLLRPTRASEAAVFDDNGGAFRSGDASREEVWLSAAVIGRRDSNGRVASAVGVVRDISVEKGEADQRDTLVAELDHRVKNVLASVQSMAAQSARRTVSLEAFLKTFFGRLEAMAAAHTLLTATRWRGAEISQVAAAELGGLAQGQARWSGPDIVLNPRATHALTLALHELAANAVKYGALSTDRGRIEVSWSATPENGFQLAWTEKDGPPVVAPTRRGFGWTLLERVTGKELGGSASLDFRPEGLRVVLSGDNTALAASKRGRPTSAPSATVEPPAEPSASMDEGQGASRGNPGEPDIRGVRVLIVEDAVLLALELESGLSESGARVVGSAADLEEATRMLTLDFDVAVLDANLNGRSVMPIAEALAGRRIPFIFATGYGDAGAAPAGFDAPVVRKPYNIGQIAAALAVALERPRDGRSAVTTH